jgi:hypothetical protein
MDLDKTTPGSLCRPCLTVPVIVDVNHSAVVVVWKLERSLAIVTLFVCRVRYPAGSRLSMWNSRVEIRILSGAP